jgi:outer membrane protein OmpA-like peptidoglycan-associated protein
MLANLDATKLEKKKPLAGKINDKFTYQATPAISANGNRIFYMFKDPKNIGSQITDDWNIWVSMKKKGKWLLGKPIEIINTPYFEGYPSITADNKDLYFIHNSNRFLDENSRLNQDLDIYHAKSVKGKWTKPIRLKEGINFKGIDEMGASISPDGSTLVYFTQGGMKSKGGFDIYIVQKDPDGEWGMAKNIGSRVNTSHNEASPYLAPDGKSLYFSSDRPGGFGSYDFYKTVLKKGKWSKAENLGDAINTPGSDLGLSIAGNGIDVYLSGQDKYGTWNLYKTKLPEAVRPKKIFLVKANIIDKKTKKKLQSEVLVEDLDTSKFIGKFLTEDEIGNTELLLVAGRRYSVSITSPGYFLFTDNFNLKKHKKYKETELTWELSPIEVGQSIVLKNIFFKSGRHNLSKKSRLALNKIIKILNANPGVHMEIGGHTDSRGNDKRNLILSKKRAKEVYKYFVKKGKLKKARFKVKGYGEKNPITSNKTKKGRKQNRRTEFIILKK